VTVVAVAVAACFLGYIGLYITVVIRTGRTAGLPDVAEAVRAFPIPAGDSEGLDTAGARRVRLGCRRR